MSELPIPPAARDAVKQAIAKGRRKRRAEDEVAEAALRAGLKAMGVQVEKRGGPSVLMGGEEGWRTDATPSEYRLVSRWLPVEQDSPKR